MINNITKKVKLSETQIIAQMTAQQKGEYKIQKAGFNLAAMKTDGFVYDPELVADPVTQAEQFSGSFMCAMNDW